MKTVMSLMDLFLDKGYNLFMDNYYTSVGLFEELEERKALSCGTVRSNRVALPKTFFICRKARAVKQLKRGESLYRKKGTFISVTWHDRKIVSVLASFPTSETDSQIPMSLKGQ